MELKDRLYEKSSYLRGDKKSKYLSIVSEYLRIKEDMSIIRTPIITSDVKMLLLETEKKLISEHNPNLKKQYFLDLIRLYSVFVSSKQGEDFYKHMKNVMDIKCLETLYKKAATLCSYGRGDDNLVVGMIRTFYDNTMMLLDDNLNTNLIDRSDVWAYETLEENFLCERLDGVNVDDLMKTLNISKSATLSYIIALYNSSKILCRLIEVESFISILEYGLDDSNLINEKLANFLREIKKGNCAIAYENHKNSRLRTMKNELNNFNNIILNVSRQ